MQSIHFKHELKAMDEMTARREYFFADLIKATSVIYGEPVSALVGDRRDRRMTRMRWRCFWLGRIELGLTYTQIGTLFRKDHTTIMHGVTKYDDLAEEAGEREAREQLKQTATAIARGELTREAADDQPQ